MNCPVVVTGVEPKIDLEVFLDKAIEATRQGNLDEVYMIRRRLIKLIQERNLP